MKRNRKQTSQSTNSNMQDACTFYRSHPNNYQLWYTKMTSGTNTYSPYILSSHSYDQGFHNALNVVSLPAEEHRVYITTSGPFMLALTNGPLVSYATRVTHVQFPTYSHIHYHPL